MPKFIKLRKRIHRKLIFPIQARMLIYFWILIVFLKMGLFQLEQNNGAETGNSWLIKLNKVGLIGQQSM